MSARIRSARSGQNYRGTIPAINGLTFWRKARRPIGRKRRCGMNGWTAVLPLVGVVIGATVAATTQYWLSRSAEKQRRREWLRDCKKQEWRELISTVSRSVRYILDNSFGVVSGEQ